MERPGWIPVVLSGATPSGVADGLAMVVIAVASLNYVWTPNGPFLLGSTIWLQVLTIAFVTVLASRSDTTRKLREELALIAYGGSSWQVWLRYFVRGLVLTTFAITPILYAEYAMPSFQVLPIFILALSVSTIGGFCYAAPSLARIRSREFVENYKG